MAAPTTDPRAIRLAHLAGVPSPYFTPLFRRLARDPRVDFTVIYCSSEGVREVDGSRYGYREQFAWDIDLLSGYRSIFLRRADRTPGLGNHTWSVRNWDVVPTLLRGRFDVLSTAGYNSVSYLLGALTQRAIGRQVLFREEQTLLDRRSAANVIAKQVLLRALFSQGRGLYISRENQRWFRQHGMPDERLFPTPYSVDNAALHADAERLAGAKPRLRAGFGIGEDGGPVLLTVGRLIEKKQPLFLLEAFRRARQRVRATLLFVGSGPLEEDLRQQVRAQQIPDVVFAGFLNRSEIGRAFAAADAFALLSRERETFGLVVNEAMNFELPAIVSDRVGCASDLVSTGHNGFVVSAHDPGEAAVAIEKLMADSDLRARMAAASLERISQWTVERTAEGFVAAAIAATQGSAAPPAQIGEPSPVARPATASSRSTAY